MRPKRYKLKFDDEESANNLLQEIYNDTQNIRSSILRLFTKWEIKVKEPGEIAAMGDQIVKLIAQQGKNTDQKIMLLKFLKEVVYNKETPKKEDEKENKTVSAEERMALIEMVNKEMNNSKRN
jgi:hypothetical protein